MIEVLCHWMTLFSQQVLFDFHEHCKATESPKTRMRWHIEVCLTWVGLLFWGRVFKFQNWPIVRLSA